MKIKVTKKTWRSTAQRRAMQKLADYVMCHYPMDGDLHKCVRGTFRIWDSSGTKMWKGAKSAKPSRRRSPKRRRSTAKRRTAMKRRTTRRTARRGTARRHTPMRRRTHARRRRAA